MPRIPSFESGSLALLRASANGMTSVKPLHPTSSDCVYRSTEGRVGCRHRFGAEGLRSFRDRNGPGLAFCILPRGQGRTSQPIERPRAARRTVAFTPRPFHPPSPASAAAHSGVVFPCGPRRSSAAPPGQSMRHCAICQAPLPHDSSACPYAVPESRAPWRGDYAAMHRGDITHLEHKTHVARWSLHNPSSQTESSLAMFRAVAAAHAGQHIAVFEIDEDRP